MIDVVLLLAEGSNECRPQLEDVQYDISSNSAGAV